MSAFSPRCLIIGLLLTVASPPLATAGGWGRWLPGHRLPHRAQEATPAPYVVVPPAQRHPTAPPRHYPAAAPGASASAYPWGHFGAHGRRSFSWHEGYYGDAWQWRSR